MKPQPKSQQNNLGASGNNIHAARRFVATKPARAAMLDADKKHRRIPLQAEPATGRQVVKMQHRIILGTSIIAMQRLLNAATNHARQGHTRSIARDERTRFLGEVAQPLGEQTGILGLPFVPMRLHGAVFQMRLKMSGLM